MIKLVPLFLGLLLVTRARQPEPSRCLHWPWEQRVRTMLCQRLPCPSLTRACSGSLLRLKSTQERFDLYILCAVLSTEYSKESGNSSFPFMAVLSRYTPAKLSECTTRPSSCGTRQSSAPSPSSPASTRPCRSRSSGETNFRYLV